MLLHDHNKRRTRFMHAVYQSKIEILWFTLLGDHSVKHSFTFL